MLVANYKFKKDLIANIGKRLDYTETSPLFSEYIPTGTNWVVGPSSQNRKWYAQIEMKDSIILKVE